MIHKTVIDKDRGLTFNVGDRVHWFEYSRDMIITNGGYGLIVAISLIPGPTEGFFLSVLKDGASEISEYPLRDCDIEELWEDYCEDN